MVSALINKEAATDLSLISLSNDTVKRRNNSLSANVKEQLIKKNSTQEKATQDLRAWRDRSFLSWGRNKPRNIEECIMWWEEVGRNSPSPIIRWKRRQWWKNGDDGVKVEMVTQICCCVNQSWFNCGWPRGSRSLVRTILILMRAIRKVKNRLKEEEKELEEGGDLQD